VNGEVLQNETTCNRCWRGQEGENHREERRTPNLIEATLGRNHYIKELESPGTRKGLPRKSVVGRPENSGYWKKSTLTGGWHSRGIIRKNLKNDKYHTKEKSKPIIWKGSNSNFLKNWCRQESLTGGRGTGTIF